MQRATIEHLRAHRKRGAKGAAWIEARVTCAPQLQLLLRAWRRVVTAPRPLTAAAAAAAAAAEEAPLTQEQWRDFKSKERKSQRAQRRLDECVALLREKPNLHTLRRFARRGARACGRPFCARPSGSSCSGRGGGVQAAGSRASSSWRRRASLGATPVAQCARTRCSARSRAFSAATSRPVEPQPPAPRRRPRALCPPLASARWSTACCSRSEATATADATS